jgi:hypothetical protein
VGGKQLRAVDGTRGGSSGQRRDASARGGASGVGRAAGGRAGGQVAHEERRGGNWQPGEMPVMGSGRRCRETEGGSRRKKMMSKSSRSSL